MIGVVQRIDYDGERVQKVVLRFPAHTSRSKLDGVYKLHENTVHNHTDNNSMSNINSTNSDTSNYSSINDSAIDSDDLILEVITCEHIGHGSFGTVYRAFCDGYPKLALKISTGKATRLRQELEVLSKVCTKGRLVLPRFEFGALNKTADLIVIGMELCVPLTLHDFLLQHPLRDETEMLFLAHQVVQAVNFVNVESCIHRDVKLQNFVFDIDGNLKLIDFGLSYSVLEPPAGDVVAGTVSFMSPEMAHNALYREARVSVGCAADVWSVGIVLFSIFTQRNPYPPQSTRTSPEATHSTSSRHRSRSHEREHFSPNSAPASQILQHENNDNDSSVNKVACNNNNNNNKNNNSTNKSSTTCNRSRRQSRATSLKANLSKTNGASLMTNSLANTFVISSTSNKCAASRSATPVTMRNEQLLRRVAAGQWKWPANVNLSPALRDLVESILITDPLQRPTTEMILRKPIWNLRRRTPPHVIMSFLGVRDDLLLSRDEGQLMRMVKERNDSMTSSRAQSKRQEQQQHSYNNENNYNNYNKYNNEYSNYVSNISNTAKSVEPNACTSESEPVLLSLSSHTEQEIVSSKELSEQATQFSSRALSVPSPHNNKIPFRGSLQVITREAGDVDGATAVQVYDIRHSARKKSKPIREITQVIAEETAKHQYKREHRSKRGKSVKVSQSKGKLFSRSAARRALSEEKCKTMETDMHELELLYEYKEEQDEEQQYSEGNDNDRNEEVIINSNNSIEHKLHEALNNELLKTHQKQLSQMSDLFSSEQLLEHSITPIHENNTINESENVNSDNMNNNNNNNNINKHNTNSNIDFSDDNEEEDTFATPVIDGKKVLQATSQDDMVDVDYDELIFATPFLPSHLTQTVNIQPTRNKSISTVSNSNHATKSEKRETDAIRTDVSISLLDEDDDKISNKYNKCNEDVNKPNQTHITDTEKEYHKLNELGRDMEKESELEEEQQEIKTHQSLTLNTLSNTVRQVSKHKKSHKSEKANKIYYNRDDNTEVKIEDNTNNEEHRKVIVQAENTEHNKENVAASTAAAVLVEVVATKNNIINIDDNNNMVDSNNNDNNNSNNNKCEPMYKEEDEEEQEKEELSSETVTGKPMLAEKANNVRNDCNAKRVMHNNNNANFTKPLDKWIGKKNNNNKSNNNLNNNSVSSMRQLGLAKPTRNRNLDNNNNNNNNKGNNYNDNNIGSNINTTFYTTNKNSEEEVKMKRNEELINSNTVTNHSIETSSKEVTLFVKWACKEHQKWNSLIHLEHEWLLASLRLTIVEDQARYNITWLAGEQYYSAAHPHTFREHRRVINKRYMDGFVCDMCNEEFLPRRGSLHVFHCSCGRDLCATCHLEYVKQCTCACCNKIYPNSYALRAHLEQEKKERDSCINNEYQAINNNTNNKKYLNSKGNTEIYNTKHNTNANKTSNLSDNSVVGIRGRKRKNNNYNNVNDLDLDDSDDGGEIDVNLADLDILSVNMSDMGKTGARRNALTKDNNSADAHTGRKRGRPSREDAAISSGLLDIREPLPKLSIAAMHQKLVEVKQSSSSTSKKRGRKPKQKMMTESDIRMEINTPTPNVTYSGFGPLPDNYNNINNNSVAGQKKTVIQAHLRFNEEAKALELAEKAIKNGTFDKKITKIPEGPWRPLAKLQQMHSVRNVLQPTAEEREAILNGDWIRHFYLYPRAAGVEPFAFVYHAQPGRIGAIYLTGDFPLHSAISAMLERHFFAIERVDTETEEDATQLTSLVRAKAHPQWRLAFDTLQEIVLYDTNMLKQHQIPGTVSVYQAPRSAYSCNNDPFLYVRWFRFSEDGTLVAFLLSNGAIQIFVKNEFELRWFDEDRKFIVRCNGVCEVINETNFALADAVDQLLYGSLSEQQQEEEEYTTTNSSL